MAAQKKLEKDSQYAHLDIDGDGVVTDEELDMDDAQGGHIASYSSGGKTEYDNLVVISAEHNRRMQDQNANDYKEAWLAEQKKTA